LIDLQKGDSKRPSSALLEIFFTKGDSFSLLFETVDSATPEKPCVQNDL
jgi:hypothetical protein